MAGYISDLKEIIKSRRREDAKTALAHLDQKTEEEQNSVIELLALAGDREALELLSFLLDHIDPGHPVHSRLFQLAVDRAHLHYPFAPLLLSHASQDQLGQVTPLLKHILARETNGSLLNQILRTVGKLRLDDLAGDVAEFIFYDDETLKKEAVKALERMGTPKALMRLEQVAGTEKCDNDVLDALDILKEKVSGSVIQEPGPAPARSGLAENTERLASRHLADRYQAYLYFSDQGERVARALRASMESRDPDLLVNLLGLAGKTIPQESLGDLIALAARKDIEKPVKFAVYTALSHFPEIESAAPLLNGATDPAMYIRMAAVKALDRHCSDYIIAEVKKKIESGTKTGEALGISILDAGAANLINALMDSDTFFYISSNYLEGHAPVRTLETFIKVLKKRNRISTVKKYTQIYQDRSRNDRPFIAVIHPSLAYLDVYAKLIHGCGYDARTFTGPQKAFESIVSQKPAALVTGLFIGNVSAPDLAREIREFYSPDDLPMVVSSLQKNLDPPPLEKEFKAAGINGYCPFPAKPIQIKSWAGAR